MSRTFIAAILICASVGAPSRALETALFADGDSVRLRSAPSLEAKVLGTLYRGDEVRVRSAQGQWREVWVPRTRQVGWVAHWLLAEVPPEGVRREVAYVNADTLNIRSGPGEGYERRGTLARGTQVDVIAYADQWRKIRVPSNGEFGWVAGWHLKSGGSGGSSGSANPSYYGDHRWVGADRLNLRANPSTGSEPMAVLLKGHKVYLMAMQGEWVKVRADGGPIGWVHRDYLKPERPEGAGGLVGSSSGSSESRWGTPRWVGVDELYLRPGPDTDNQPMAILTRGTKVYLMYLQDDWAQVHVHNGEIGWVFRDYLKADPVGGNGSIVALTEAQSRESYDSKLESLIDSMSDDQAVVTKTECNLRQGPGTAFAVVGKVSLYDRLRVHGQASGWLKVTTSGGQPGWIASWLCATRVDPPAVPAAEVPEPPSRAVIAGQGDTLGLGKRIAELALAQVGRPYVWGAESPSSGFDCSGLVYWAHGQVGIRMMRTTWDQWEDSRGRAVPMESLQPGDVVCFANTYRHGVSHVGIYIGNGQFVHAPGRGQSVRVDSLSARTRSYCGARRFY